MCVCVCMEIQTFAFLLFTDDYRIGKVLLCPYHDSGN